MVNSLWHHETIPVLADLHKVTFSTISSMYVSENTSECFINYLIYARLTKRIGKSKVPLPLPLSHIFPHSTMKGPLPFSFLSFIFQVFMKILQPMAQQDSNSWGSILNEFQKVKLSLFFINLPWRAASNSSSFNQWTMPNQIANCTVQIVWNSKVKTPN